jgi:hypothetical protein
MTIAAIIDNRTTPLFIAAIRVLIEQRGCVSAAFLSRGRDFQKWVNLRQTRTFAPRPVQPPIADINMG